MKSTMNIPFQEECLWALTFAHLFVMDHCSLHITDLHLPSSLSYLHCPNWCAPASWSTENSFTCIPGRKQQQQQKSATFGTVFIQQNWTVFSLACLLGEFTNCVLCPQNLWKKARVYSVLKTYDDMGCFPHIYLFFVRSVHISWQ